MVGVGIIAILACITTSRSSPLTVSKPIRQQASGICKTGESGVATGMDSWLVLCPFGPVSDASGPLWASMQGWWAGRFDRLEGFRGKWRQGWGLLTITGAVITDQCASRWMDGCQGKKKRPDVVPGATQG